MDLINTKRLILRQWKESDLEPFESIGKDAEVMRFFPSVLDKGQSMALYSQIQDHYNKHGYGAFAVEERSTNKWIGFIGLHHVGFEASFTPCVEIAWRLAQSAWGKGYATEGAKACLEFAFDRLSLPEVYSFTATINKPSERVMQKIGMKKIGEFDHPDVAEGHVLKRHVLYKADRYIKL